MSRSIKLYHTYNVRFVFIFCGNSVKFLNSWHCWQLLVLLKSWHYSHIEIKWNWNQSTVGTHKQKMHKMASSTTLYSASFSKHLSIGLYSLFIFKHPFRKLYGCLQLLHHMLSHSRVCTHASIRAAGVLDFEKVSQWNFLSDEIT